MRTVLWKYENEHYLASALVPEWERFSTAVIFIPCKIYFQIENFISADQEKSEHVKIVFESVSNIQIYSWGNNQFFSYSTFLVK